MKTDREDFIKIIRYISVIPVGAKRIADALIACGATIPVRCKECVHYHSHGIGGCDIGFALRVFKSDFCSRGERKEE